MCDKDIIKCNYYENEETLINVIDELHSIYSELNKLEENLLYNGLRN